jgi:hypothetical protein
MKDPQKRRATPDEALLEVNSYDEIPAFASEDQEDAFWSTHRLGERMLKGMKPRSVAEALNDLRAASATRAPRTSPKRRRSPAPEGEGRDEGESEQP